MRNSHFYIINKHTELYKYSINGKWLIWFDVEKCLSQKTFFKKTITIFRVGFTEVIRISLYNTVLEGQF